jgi:CheY-like chemotaxis protein
MSYDPAGAPQDVPLSNSSLRTSRLLICDDSPVERLALAHLLRQVGYEVDEAGDGQTGLQQLKHRPIDLLLLDLNMPEVDGFGVLSYVQEHRPGLPVILLSGMPLDQIQQKMNRLRTQELPPLLLKPIDPQQLLQMIDLQLSGELPDWHDAEQAK